MEDESTPSLEDALFLKELYTAIMSTDNGQSPKVEGLPAEFYKSPWISLQSSKTVVIKVSWRKAVEGPSSLCYPRRVT